MVLNRSAAGASCAAVAALLLLLMAAPAAPAADLPSEPETKHSQLEKIEQRKGVLTTTIAGFGEKIDRLTAEVADIRTREAAVRERLAANQVGTGEHKAGADAGRARAGP